MKKSKTKIIEENRQARKVLDLIINAAEDGKLDNVASLVNTDYDTKKVNGQWTTEVKKTQASLQDLDEKIEFSRKITVDALQIISEQLRNYNRLIQDKELLEYNNRTTKDIRKSESSLKNQTEKAIESQAKHLTRSAVVHEEFEDEKLTRSVEIRQEYEEKLATDDVFAIKNKYLKFDFEMGFFHELERSPENEKCQEEIKQYLETHPEHPQGKIGKAITYFVELQDRIILDEKFRMKKEANQKAEDERIDELVKKYTAKPIPMESVC